MEKENPGDRKGRICPGVRVGPYVVRRVLAEGGMGRVFAAVDVLTGQEVAIKTVLSPDPGLKEYFRSEIATLAAIQHPSVVAFHTHGVHEDEPWYAMELLVGATLRDAMVGATTPSPGGQRAECAVAGEVVRTRLVTPGGGRLPTQGNEPGSAWNGPSRERLVKICVDLFRAIEHVHARGVVHGDIKPENVFLRGEDRPVLVDFGVAIPFDCARERLVLVPRSIGSIAYMSPECLNGGLPDARADLYALGCLLYECLTGVHPLLRDTADGTKLAHLRADVVPPSRYFAEMPRQWEAMIMRLLAKAPADRPGFASDVLAVLASADSTPDGTAPSARPAPRHLFRAPLIGRDRPLERLRAALADASRGVGNSLLLRAGPGMGKTRLLLELVQGVVQEDALCLHVECAPARETSLSRARNPVRLIFDRLRDHVDVRRPDVGAALDDLESAFGQLERLPPTDPGRAPAGERAVADLVAIIQAVARSHTVAVIVDDLQDADELTRELVRQVTALGGAGGRLLLVCATEGGDEPLPYETLTLETLDESEVERAVRAMLAIEHPSPTLIDQAVQVSQGNPFILGRYLRALIDAGILQHDRHRGWRVEWPSGDRGDANEARHAPIIESVTTLFEWRLRALSEKAIGFAGAAALFGTDIDLETWAYMMRVPRQEANALADVLSRWQVAEPRGPARYRISHPLLAQALVRRIPLAMAARLHRRAAAVLWLERRRCGGTPDALADHLRACGGHAKAALCFAELGRWYASNHRRREALESFEAAIEQRRASAPNGPQRDHELSELYEAAGDVAVSLRQYARAEKAFRNALMLCATDVVRSARQLRKIAGAQQRSPDEALRNLDDGMMLLAHEDGHDPGRRFEWIQAHLDAMWIHYWRQRTKAVLALATRIESEVRRFGTAHQNASLDFNMAVGLMQANRYVTGPAELEHVQRALDVYLSLDDRQNVAMCRFLRSMILLFSGELDAAEAGFDAVLMVGERATSVTIRVRALTFLCMVHRKRRTRERVRKLATACLSLATEHSMPEYRGTAMANLAWVALQDGELLECETLAQQAIAEWDRSPLNVFRWTALLPLMALVLAREERSTDGVELAALAQRLLDPGQQRLPDAVTHALATLCDPSTGTVQAAREAARHVLEVAATAGLL